MSASMFDAGAVDRDDLPLKCVGELWSPQLLAQRADVTVVSCPVDPANDYNPESQPRTDPSKSVWFIRLVQVVGDEKDQDRKDKPL